MMKKILPLLMLIMLIAPAFAAITVTWNTPSSGQVINNLTANIRQYDLNFRVQDNNANVEDLNALLYYFPRSTRITQGAGDAIVADLNISDAIANPTATQACVPESAGSLTDLTCSVKWTIPNNTTMPDDIYNIDVNVRDVGRGGDDAAGVINSDKNGTVQIEVYTRMTGAQSVRDLMGIVGVVLAGVVLLTGLGSIVVLKTDLTKTAIITVVAAVAVAIAAMLIGTVLVAL